MKRNKVSPFQDTVLGVQNPSAVEYTDCISAEE